jgi:hypothetical protein
MLKTIVLATTIVTGVSFAAKAVCTARDLIGSWTMSAVGFSGAQTFLGTCDFTIATDGDLSGSCTAHDLEDSFRGRVSGNLKVSPRCRVTGAFASQEDVGSEVEARMNLSKDVITGISLDPSTINQFTAVKARGHHRAHGKRPGGGDASR